MACLSLIAMMERGKKGGRGKKRNLVDGASTKLKRDRTRSKIAKKAVFIFPFGLVFVV